MTGEVPTWRVPVELAAESLHRLHGSRGLLAAATGLLVMALLEPLLPPLLDHGILLLPILVVLAVGLFTLPREGVAAQWRALALIGEPDAQRRMLKRLVWPALLVVLLLPRSFLALYGIPHLSPWAGLLDQGIQQRVATVALYVVFLLPVLYLRSSRIYAPDILAKRPRDLDRADGTHDARDVLLFMLLSLLVLWGWLLWPFWRPTALNPFAAAHLQSATQAAASVGFGLVLPMILWITLIAHASLLREMAMRKALRRQRGTVALAALHVALALLAIVLHAYDVLWIVRYQSAALF